MSLTVKRRGKFYHAQGTIHIGTTRFRVRQSTGRTDRIEAEQATRQIEAAIIRRALGNETDDPNKIPFTSLVTAYRARAKPIHPNDEDRIIIMLRRFGKMPVEDIKTLAWDKFIKAKLPGRAPATINRYRSTMRAILRYSEDMGYRIPAIPTAIGQVGKSGKADDRIRYLAIPDQDRLILAYHERVQPIIIMLCFQGCRVSEALRLQWPDLDLDRGFVTFTEILKGNRRTVPMHSRVVQSLTRLHNQRQRRHDYVHVRPGGEPYTERRDGGAGIKRAHAGALDRSGIANFRIHDWRHHWASHMVMAGAPLRAVQELGGWSSLKMVQRYSQLSPEHLRSSINLLQPDKDDP